MHFILLYELSHYGLRNMSLIILEVDLNELICQQCRMSVLDSSAALLRIGTRVDKNNQLFRPETLHKSIVYSPFHITTQQ